jgi:hypothetical protein
MTAPRRTALALAATLAALAPAARAEAPCAADAKRFCSGKGPVELVSCLQAHRPDLAPGCVDRLERVLVFFQNAAEACKYEAFESCRGTAPGMAMVDCLRAQQGKLSPMCQQFFDAARGRDEAAQKACGDEAARACPGIAPGRGALWICLGMGGADLSAACQSAL